MNSKLWRPLLEGNLATQAWEAVWAIARALETTPLQPSGLSPERQAMRAATLAGKAGFALFHGYFSKTAGDEANAYAALAEDCLDEAVEAVVNIPMDAGLYTGFTGIAWVAEHLSRVLAAGEVADSSDDEDINEETDTAVLAMLGRSPWREQYDLISGLVGFGVYALERFPRSSAVRCLEAVIDRLAETSVRDDQGGVTWFTPPELLPSRDRDLTPLGYYDLGVAHGVSGVIPLLAEACRLGVRQKLARTLLQGAVHWLLAQGRPDNDGPSYAFFLDPELEPSAGRLAWCYGDPGIAATLLHAAHATTSEAWELEALAIAARAAQASPEISGVRDAGLCHGALGLAHLYNRIYQASGRELFAEAARLWYQIGLKMRSPERGIAGFACWEVGEDGQKVWTDDPGFLTGAAGIGLSLLAAVTAIEPAWDRLLLVSSYPQTRAGRGVEEASAPS